MGIEKWTINENSLVDLEKYGWSVDIDNKGTTMTIIEVWGTTKEECLSRAKRICAVNEMEAALREQIEIEKSDTRYVHSAISQERHHERLLKLESILNDLEP